MRLTCTSTLFMCLGQEDAADLRAPLRASEGNELISAATAEGIAAASLGGLASGFLGVGCAACGTLILSPALTFLGVGALLVASLPFGGEEFGLVGVALLVLSLILGAKKISQLTACSPATSR